MKEVSTKNFGLIIAFLLPGFVSLWGISIFSETVRHCLGTSSQQQPSFGGFLFIRLASIANGVFISALRWSIIDNIHHHTGIKKNTLNFSKLQEKYDAFSAVVENHCRYYQYYANMLIAVLIAYISYEWLTEKFNWLLLIPFIIIEGTLFFGSRSSLDLYYKRAAQILKSEKEV